MGDVKFTTSFENVQIRQPSAISETDHNTEEDFPLGRECIIGSGKENSCNEEHIPETSNVLIEKSVGKVSAFRETKVINKIIKEKLRSCRNIIKSMDDENKMYNRTVLTELKSHLENLFQTKGKKAEFNATHLERKVYFDQDSLPNNDSIMEYEFLGYDLLDDKYEHDLKDIEHLISRVHRCISFITSLYCEIADPCAGVGELSQKSSRKISTIEKIEMATVRMKNQIIESEDIGNCLEELKKRVGEIFKELLQQRKEIGRVNKEKIDIQKLQQSELEELRLSMKENEVFLNSRIEELKAKIFSETERTVNSLMEVEELYSKNKYLYTENDGLYKVISNRNKDIKLLRKQNCDLILGFDRVNKEKIDIQMLHQSEVEKLQSLIKEQTDNEVFLKSRIEELEAEVVSETDRSMDSLIEVEELYVENEDLYKENDGLYEVISNRNKEIKLLRKLNNDLRMRIEQINQQKVDIKQLHQSELKKLQLSIEEKTENETFLNSRIEELEEEVLSETERTIDSLIEVEELDIENYDLQAKIVSLHEVIVNRNKEIEQLREEIIDLREQLVLKSNAETMHILQTPLKIFFLFIFLIIILSVSSNFH